MNFWTYQVLVGSFRDWRTTNGPHHYIYSSASTRHSKTNGGQHCLWRSQNLSWSCWLWQTHTQFLTLAVVGSSPRKAWVPLWRQFYAQTVFLLAKMQRTGLRTNLELSWWIKGRYQAAEQAWCTLAGWTVGQQPGLCQFYSTTCYSKMLVQHPLALEKHSE